MIHFLYSSVHPCNTILGKFIRADSVNMTSSEDLKTFDFGIANQLNDIVELIRITQVPLNIQNIRYV